MWILGIKALLYQSPSWSLQFLSPTSLNQHSNIVKSFISRIIIRFPWTHNLTSSYIAIPWYPKILTYCHILISRYQASEQPSQPQFQFVPGNQPAIRQQQASRWRFCLWHHYWHCCHHYWRHTTIDIVAIIAVIIAIMRNQLAIQRKQTCDTFRSLTSLTLRSLSLRP